MNCTHCGKRLSRKTARQIEGVVMCSKCMFLPPKWRAPPQGMPPEGPRREGGSGASAPASPVGEADAPNPTGEIAALREALELIVSDCSYHLSKYRPAQLEIARTALKDTSHG